MTRENDMKVITVVLSFVSLFMAKFIELGVDEREQSFSTIEKSCVSEKR